MLVFRIESRRQHDDTSGRRPQTQVEWEPDDPDDPQSHARTGRGPDISAGESDLDLPGRVRLRVEMTPDPQVQRRGQSLADRDLVGSRRIGPAALDKPRTVHHVAE